MGSCGRITVKKEKNRYAKKGVLWVVSENGERRFTKSTKAAAKKAAKAFKRNC